MSVKEQAVIRFSAYEVLDQLPSPVIITNSSSEPVFINARAGTLFAPGLQRSNLQLTLAELLNDTYRLVEQKIGVVKATRTPLQFEYHYLRENLWFDCHITVLSDGYSICLQDISSRKLLEGAKEGADYNYEMLVNTIDGIVWEFDPAQSRFNVVSNQAEKLLGYPVQQWLEEKGFWEKHIHPDDKDWVLNYCHAKSETEQLYEFSYRMIAADSSVVWLRDIVAVVRKDGIPVILKGLMIDISREKKIIDELVKANELYNMVMMATNDVIWDWHLTSNKVRWNENFFNLLGYDRATECDHISFWHSILHPADRDHVIESIENTIKGSGKFWSQEYRMFKKSGEMITVFDRGYLICDEHNKPYRMIGSMMDISGRKYSEEELSNSYQTIRRLSGHLQEVREEERKSIAREIHDELGQQVTVMKMEVTWLITLLPPGNLPLLQKLEGLLELLNETVTSIRRISSELRPSLLDDLGLRSAMEWHIKEFERRSSIHSSISFSEDELLLPDSVKIAFFRILQESLTNVARHSQASHVSVELTHDNNVLVMHISDDGVGMNLSRLKEIRTWGILGMQERVDLMGGTFAIESSPGRGTHIRVTMPWKNTIGE